MAVDSLPPFIKQKGGGMAVRKITNPTEKLKKGERLDETCKCGHLKSKHKDLVSIGITNNHGADCTKCDCARFTWTGFVAVK